MLRRVIHFLLGLCMFVGLVISWGAAGAADCMTMSPDETTTRAIIGISLMAAGMVGLKLTKWEHFC